MEGESKSVSESLPWENLTEEEVKKLVQRAITEGKEESRYLLRIEEWNRPGDSFTDYGEFKVIYGNVETVLVDKEYDYPTTNKDTYIVIPKTKVVVIFFEEGDNYKGKTIRHAELYVFSHNHGWRKIELY